MDKSIKKETIFVNNRALREFFESNVLEINMFLSEYQKILIRSANNDPYTGFVFIERINKIDDILCEMNKFTDLPF